MWNLRQRTFRRCLLWSEILNAWVRAFKMMWPLQFYIAGSQVGLPTHKRKQSASRSPFHSSSQRHGGRQGIWSKTNALTMPSRLHQQWRWPGQLQFLHVPPLTYFSSTMFALETNLYLQDCHRVEYISYFRHPIRAPVSRKKWDSKGLELTDKQLLQPRNFCNVEEGRGNSLVHGPSWIYFGTDCTFSIFPFPVHRQRLCEMPGGKPNILQGKWELKSFVSIAALIGTKLLPFKYSRLSLLWLFAWVLPSGSPIHINIKT